MGASASSTSSIAQIVGEAIVDHFGNALHCRGFKPSALDDLTKQIDELFKDDKANQQMAQVVSDQLNHAERLCYPNILDKDPDVQIKLRTYGSKSPLGWACYFVLPSLVEAFFKKVEMRSQNRRSCFFQLRNVLGYSIHVWNVRNPRTL